MAKLPNRQEIISVRSDLISQPHVQCSYSVLREQRIVGKAWTLELDFLPHLWDLGYFFKPGMQKYTMGG